MIRSSKLIVTLAALSGVVLPHSLTTVVGYPLRAPTQAADTVKVLLAEVLFAPAPGASSFVELANVGARAVDLSSMVLRIDTLEFPLPQLAQPFAAGARVVIRFDGGETIDGNVVHASSDFALRSEGGTVTLLWNDDRVIDRIAWGDAPNAIVPLLGGVPRERVNPGSSFGRPPGANQPGASTDWVMYPVDQVTPGRPNPLPAVAVLLPVSGAILPATTVNLSWYPVPGAVRYRVQLGRDTAFAPSILDRTVDVPSVSSGQLAAGVYWWRVQAIPAEGPAAAWSPPSRIEFENRSGGGGSGSGDTDGGDEEEGDSPEPLGGLNVQNVAPVLLPVPMIYQHKDSKMLLLESRQSGGPRTARGTPRMPHAWDRDHVNLDQDDPADNTNCAIASMTMLNRYYGGDLTQDRIGYEVRGPNIARYQGMVPAGLNLHRRATFREQAPGPERDLNYGFGLWDEEIVAVGIFALGAAPGPGSGLAPGRYYHTTNALWTTIVAEIHARRPLMGIVPGHAIVIRGYEIRNGQRLIHVNDPWSGPYIMYFDLGSAALGRVEKIFAWPSHPAIGRLEPVSKQDSDDDKVLDFDEINRFHTDPNNTDSDADGVPDKEDIESGVFEDEHRLGYAWNPSYGSPGRDFDADGTPTELDPDSDDGGCKDGDEDLSRDGYREGRETGNFDQTDDACGNLRGNVSYLFEAVNSHPDHLTKISHDRGIILVRLRPESPGSRRYVDDSSTYNYQGFSRSALALPTCTFWGRVAGHGSGVFPVDRIGATVDSVTMALGVQVEIPARSSGNGCRGAGTADAELVLSLPDCDGIRETPAAGSPRGMRTFRFNCTVPPNLGPGWNVTQFYVRGFVRLQSAPPTPPNDLTRAAPATNARFPFERGTPGRHAPRRWPPSDSAPPRYPARP